MKKFSKVVSYLLIVAAVFFSNTVTTQGQSVMLPTDPTITYNAASPPVIPPYGQIAKWVRTKRLSWNTDSYKPYYYKGSGFRLKFPKTYTTLADGKTYPIIVMFHGAGEAAPATDDEYCLYHGGQPHMNAVDNGTFDGYVFYMQGGSGWGDGDFDKVKEILDYMVINNKLDRFRINVHGLSAGGQATWNFMARYPTYVAGGLPMSGTDIGYKSQTVVQPLKFTSIWDFQGYLDGSPAPSTSEQVKTAFDLAGGNMKHTVYPDLGHGTWDRAYAEPDFFPFQLRSNKANPWALFGRTQFCPGDVINITLGVTAGFDGYEWMNGASLIPGANGNTLQVTAPGIYSCRVRMGTLYSAWSPIPANVFYKGPTVPPTITLASSPMSKVLPTPDAAKVTLSVPSTYATYLWKNVSNSTTLSTTNTVDVTTPGNYVVKVTEQFGCSSDFSAPFTVVDANGSPKPDAAIGLAVTTDSKTSLRLDWSNNPNPVVDETNFEIYQSSTPGGPYHLIAIKNANVLTHLVTGLNSNSAYYYEVRAVGSSGSAAVTAEATGTTAADVTPPTAPTNLAVSSSTRSSVSLTWTAATDDVGVTNYDVFINGVKSYVTTATQFTVYNLDFGKSYNFAIKARDFANNSSPFSNQISAEPLRLGLDYKYYTFTGTWNALPDFSTLTPLVTGTMQNVAITPRTQEDNFAFLWNGYIVIPVTGTYYFRTNSDDGSRLWLGALGSSVNPYSFSATTATTLVVNNDGLHGGQDATSAALTLQAGVYPIAMAFYEQGGGQQMTVTWRTPSSGTSFVAIPNGQFSDPVVNNGSAPSAPSALTATAVSYSKINLAWTDNSNNENGFEIWRSTNGSTGFNTVGFANANATTFVDSGLLSSTKYFYKIRATGQFGQSAFSGTGTGVDYAYYTQTGLSNLPDFNTLVPVSTGHTAQFDLTVPHQEDNFQLKFSGSITLPTTGTYTFYTTSDDGSKLYIDGFDAAHQVVNNDFLQGPTERSGTKSLTAGVHTIFVTFFESGGGQTLEVRYAGPAGSGISKQIIPASALGTPLPSATTLALPGSPAAPTGLIVTGASTSKIHLSWTDVATTEDKYEIYRSATTNTNYVLLTTLAANATSFDDAGLFANSTFFYKVRAVNVGGPSAFSAEGSASTLDNIPVITAIGDKYGHFGTTITVNIVATDTDPETLNMTTSALPAFGSFTPTGNGLGTLTFTPAQSDQNTYPITVTVTDQHGGSTNQSFNLIVNDNYTPVIAPVSNIAVNENQTGQVNLSATDQNATDVLTWSFTGLPGFATVTTGTGTAQISFAPGYADNGNYPVIATVSDGHSGTDTKTFTVTINDINPNKKIFINFTSGLQSNVIAPAPWNNLNKIPALNDSFPNMLDNAGNASNINLKVLSSWQAVGNGTNASGAVTNNNSGVYPDNVLRSAYWTDTRVQTIRISGLLLSTTYNFTFLGSRSGLVTDNKTTVYTIKGTSVSLNAAANTANTVSVTNLTPDADGTLTLTLKPGTGSPNAYLNAMVIEPVFNNATPPATPRNLLATLAGAQINLTWVDAAYNETAYEVYRSTVIGGPYTLLNPGAANPNTVTYNDGAVSGGTTYFYFVRATNAYGVSGNSDTSSATTANTAPILANIANVSMVAQQVVDVNVSATDNAGDIITLKATGLPSFASFTDNGNGAGVIHIAPGFTLGSFTGITISATDNGGASSTKQFNITVTASDPDAPTQLKASGATRTSVVLRWTDNSSVETGYEIYRSTTADAGFILIGTVGANVNTFTDGTVTGSGLFYYQVRAILGASFSTYSNVAGSSAVTSQVFVNFDDADPAGAPWNNTLNGPLDGDVYANLLNDLGNPSGINLTVIGQDFTGTNHTGMNTGTDAGIYPDNVLKMSWYVDLGSSGKTQLDGLNQSMAYTITFTGSRDGQGAYADRTTKYTAGSQSVLLNVINNISHVVQIINVKPDQNGIIPLAVDAAGNSPYGYMGAIVVSGYLTAGQGTGDNSYPSTTGVENATGTNAANAAIAARTLPDSANDAVNFVSAYPNPFLDDVTLKITLQNASNKMSVVVYDMSGKALMLKELSNVPAGTSLVKLGLNSGLQKGVYFVQVRNGANGKSDVIKIVRQ